MESKKKLRVNLGSGTDYLRGWVNVDVDTTQKVDLIADLSAPFPFKTNSVDELKASDILEHFTKEDGELFLRECHRVLKPGGTIFLRTHNPYQIYKQFGHDPEVMFHFLYGNTMSTGIFGAHKYAYSEKMLRKVAGLIGFDIVSFQKETTNLVVILRKVTKDQHIFLKYISDRKGSQDDAFLKLIRKVPTVSCKQEYYKYPITFTGSTTRLLKSLVILPFVFLQQYRIIGNYKKEGIGMMILNGFSDKLVASWAARMHAVPVIWLEDEKIDACLHKNFLVPKMLYRFSKEIPEYVFVKNEKKKQMLMREGRVSLAKIVVLENSISLERIRDILLLTKFSYEK